MLTIRIKEAPTIFQERLNFALYAAMLLWKLIPRASVDSAIMTSNSKIAVNRTDTVQNEKGLITLK